MSSPSHPPSVISSSSSIPIFKIPPHSFTLPSVSSPILNSSLPITPISSSLGVQGSPTSAISSPLHSSPTPSSPLHSSPTHSSPSFVSPPSPAPNHPMTTRSKNDIFVPKQPFSLLVQSPPLPSPH